MFLQSSYVFIFTRPYLALCYTILMLNQVTLIAHRGFSTDAPENTLAAFDLALTNNFPDIEFDVQLSSDGVPVVIHDATLDRTTNGHGALNELTLSQIKVLDAGSWFSPSFTGSRVPCLREVLLRYSGCANLHIELKSNEPELPVKVAQLLIETGWVEEALAQSHNEAAQTPILVISSYDRDQVVRSQTNLHERIIHELLVEEVSDESLEWAADHGLKSYLPSVNDITPELVHKANELDLEIGGWWDNWDPTGVHGLAEAGARHAFVDSPLEARAALPTRPEMPMGVIQRLMWAATR